MASKEVADLTLRPVLDGTEEFHLVAGVTRSGGGAVTNYGNSRRATLAEVLTYIQGNVSGGISQAFADGRYLQKANNLGDVASAVTARSNLSVYSIAQVDALIAGVSGGGPVLLATHTTAAGETSFTLMSGIPQTYRELLIEVRGGSTGNSTTNSEQFNIQFNGDTGFNYKWTLLNFYPTGLGSTGTANTTNIAGALLPECGLAGINPNTSQIRIPRYTQSDGPHYTYSTSPYQQSNIGIATGEICGEWIPGSATAINRIDCSINAFAFKTGTIVKLYGVP